MSSKQLTILLIEDSRIDQTLIEGLLGKVRNVVYDAHHADYLSAGLVRISQGHFDAVLLDLSLPDSCGLESCIKVREFAPELPIVVLTALDDEEVALQALNQGAQDYLVKGQIDASKLSRALRYAIERKKGELALQKAHDELERRKHLAELAHLARLNTMGEMASGMAHELNQPLTALVGYAESGLERLHSHRWEPEDLDHVMERIVTEAKRASEIIKRLRKLVRKREPERGPTGVNELVHTVADMLRFEAEAMFLRLKLELDDRIPIIQADGIQIEQVLLNLARNAFESMQDADVERREVVIKTNLDGIQSVVVQVIDQGQLAESADLDRLFDPYFTTKSRGLGMGLSICRSVIEAHSGQLTVASNPDCGLTFRFTLPITEPDAHESRRTEQHVNS